VKGYEIPRYRYHSSHEQLSGEKVTHEVVVIGGGLVGLTTALELGRQGLHVVVLDDDNTVGVRGLASRGVSYAQRSLQFFQRLGIYDRVAAKGVSWSRAQILQNDTCLYEYSLVKNAAEKYPPFVNLQQYYLEQFLVERIAQFPNVEIRWENKVCNVNQDDEQVSIEVETPEGPYQVHAQWVVACDGAWSATRQALGLEPEVRTFDDTWLIVDFELKEQLPPLRVVWIESEDNNGKAIWFHPMADNVWRLDYQIGKYEDAEIAAIKDHAAETVRQVLTHRLNREDIEFELVWVGPWTYRTYVLDSLKHQRILFAGDAAHLKSPFGARGGNSGIQDAENLGWKLARVVSGKAPASLLETYNLERREAALENVRVTTRTSRFLAPRSSQEYRMRTVIQQLARSLPFARALVNGGRMTEANQYRASPACVYDEAAESFKGGIVAGAAAVDARLSINGRAVSLIDLFGVDFKVLIVASFQVKQKARDAAKIALDQGLEVLVVCDGSVIDGLEGEIEFGSDDYGDVALRYGSGDLMVYLIRPDAYVGWRSRECSASALALALKACAGLLVDTEECARA